MNWCGRKKQLEWRDSVGLATNEHVYGLKGEQIDWSGGFMHQSNGVFWVHKLDPDCSRSRINFLLLPEQSTTNSTV